MRLTNRRTSNSRGKLVVVWSTGIIAWALLGMAGFLAPRPSQADPRDLRACVKRGVSFDGRWPLQFDRIAGASGAKLYVYSSFPDFCASGDARCSKDRPYLLTGQEVAVGKTCGRWSYIDYVGTTRITKGWVSGSRLSLLRKVGNGTGTPLFKMNKGHGVPVCEAYLQRLNVTDYRVVVPRPPYCGIPENDEVPGFQVLPRVDLPTQTIVKLSGKIFNWWERPNPRFERDWSGSDQQVGTTMMAWRYDPPIDINNDGKPDDIILWQGYGLQADVDRCGDLVTEYYKWGFRPRRLPLIMSQDFHIDTEETARVFGRLGGGILPTSELRVGQPPFQPVGHFITPFRYNGLTYFSAFFDVTGDDRGLRKGDPRLANVLAVLLRRDHKTRQVCEYRMAGSDFPPADAQPSGVIAAKE